MLIGEIARMAHLSKDGIRHYEALGLIASTARAAGSRVYRDYDISVMKRIEQIRQMQQLGFELKEMKPVLEAYEQSGPMPKEMVITFLQERLAIVRRKIDDLQDVEAFIRTKLDGYLVEVTPDCAHPATTKRGRRMARVS